MSYLDPETDECVYIWEKPVGASEYYMILVEEYTESDLVPRWTLNDDEETGRDLNKVVYDDILHLHNVALPESETVEFDQSVEEEIPSSEAELNTESIEIQE